MKKLLLASVILLQACATPVNRTPDLHSTGKLNAVVACVDKQDSADIVRYANADRSRGGQALKVRRMIASGKCALITKGTYTTTSEEFEFYIDEETIQRRWSGKKYVAKIYKDQNAYWLVPSK